MAAMYVKQDTDGYVRDIIEYPYEGYDTVDVALPLPDTVIAGWWKLQDGAFVRDEARYAARPLPEAEQLLLEAEDRILELEYENLLLKGGMTA